MEIRKITEETASVTETISTLTIDVDCDFIEIYNKGPNTVYFRTDGTTVTPGAAGNGDEVTTGVAGMRMIPVPAITAVKLICASSETAKLLVRSIFLA